MPVFVNWLTWLSHLAAVVAYSPILRPGPDKFDDVDSGWNYEFLSNLGSNGLDLLGPGQFLN